MHRHKALIALLFLCALTLTIAPADESTAQPTVCISPLPPRYITIPDLQKPVVGLASRYTVTNKGAGLATTYHTYCSSDHTFVAEMIDEIDIGATDTYRLEEINDVPLGYQGYAVIASDQIIIGTLFSPLPPTYLPVVLRDGDALP